MKTLIVPDIHEQISRLNQIEVELFPEADRVVFLGDFFDTHNKQKHTQEICEWLLKHTKNPRMTFLWGNHDCHYVFTHPHFRCTGYNWHTQTTINSMLDWGVWEKFKVYTRVGVFLVSHAGFNHETIHLAKPEVALEAVKLAFDGDFHAVWNPGQSVGGIGVGGPTWLRWDRSCQPDCIDVFDVPQVVGHTHGKDVRTISHETGSISYNLDTDLNHVMWIDDLTNEVEIVGLS